ncbi:MAG: ABC transporter permease [Bacteroidota bacterium]
MFDYDKWQEIFASLKRHKLRTFATALAVWWGIFMLVILLGAGNGLRNSAERDFADDAINSLYVWRGRTSKPYKGYKAGRRIQFHNRDPEAIRANVEGVDLLSARYFPSSKYMTEYGGKALNFRMRAVEPEYQLIEYSEMIQGRYINDVDIKKKRKVAIIGDIAKDKLFGEEVNALGEYVKINGTRFQIVGVFFDGSSKREREFIYMPITTAQAVFDKEDRVHGMVITVNDETVEGSNAIAEQVRRELAAINHFDPEDTQAIGIYNNIEGYQEFKMVFTGFSFFIWFVGIGSIIAGVVGVSNIMLITVKDRTKEIGIRKALGATPWSIVSMIMQESIFLTAIAGYLGLIMGFSIIYGIDYLMTTYEIDDLEFFYNPEVDFTSVMLALLFLIVCGTLAGLVPALKAARVNPVVAMKS